MRTGLGVAAGLLALAIGCRQPTPPDLLTTATCESPSLRSGRALEGLVASDAGVVGPTHHFSRDVSLPAATPITSVHLREGSVVYEAQTISETRTYQASSALDLRRQFRAMVAAAPRPTSGVTNRAAVGYEQAPFVIDYSQLDGEAPSPRAGGNDNYPAYTRWRVEYGWEDGAIIETKGANGDATFRFDPSRLYANISSAMRLPRWKPGQEDRPVWHRFICDLQEHEALHVDIGRAVAEHVLHELTLVSAPSRAALEKAYYFVWREGIAWGQREDDRLDVYTGHGPLL